METIKVNHKENSNKFHILNSLILIIFMLGKSYPETFLSDNRIIAPSIILVFLFIFNISILNTRYLLPILFYFFIGIFSSVILGHSDFFNIISEVLNLILFFVIIPQIKLTKDEMDDFFIYVIFLAVCYTLIFVVFGIDSLGDNRLIRNNNNLAQTLMIPLFLACYSKKLKKMHLPIIIFILFGILQTSSRTAIISVSIFLIIFFTFGKINLKYIIKIVTILIVIFGILYFYSANIEDYFYELFKQKENSTFFTNREYLWRLGLNCFYSNPIFGIGRNNSNINELVVASLGIRNSEFHSFYIETLATKGIVGGLFYIFIFIRMFKNLLKLKNKFYEYYKLSISIFIAILVYMLAETFVPFYLYYSNYITAICLASFPIILCKSKEE